MADEPLSYPDEIWKPVVDPRFDEDLEASDYGRIRRMPRICNHLGRSGTGVPYKSFRDIRLAHLFFRPRRSRAGKALTGNGYLYANVHYAGRKKMMGVPVHILICAAFHGPRPTPKHEVAHADGISENITPGNLRWALPVENNADKIVHGTYRRGADTNRAKLDDAKVRKIRDIYAGGGLSHASIAALFDVSAVTIGHIIRGHTWTHVS